MCNMLMVKGFKVRDNMLICILYVAFLRMISFAQLGSPLPNTNALCRQVSLLIYCLGKQQKSTDDHMMCREEDSIFLKLLDDFYFDVHEWPLGSIQPTLLV